MNYLAHSFLSFGNEPVIIGNFIADHIKFNQGNDLPIEIRAGVTLHRKIDYFTDTHPLFIECKRFFYDGFEKYSGILVDIYFDYLLAINFNKFSKENLRDFTKSIYKILEKNRSFLIYSSSRFFDYVLEYDTLFSYATMDGIERVLTHLSHRIKHPIELQKSIPLFKAHQKEMEEKFLVFMNELILFAKSELN